MEYSSLTDFDSKLDALKNPNCPGEIIDKIVMDDDFPWGSEKAEVAKDLIASHSNTLPKQLENLFKNAANKEQKHKILLNPSCPKSLVEIGVREELYRLKELEGLSENHNITSGLAKELFIKGVRLKNNAENEDEANIGIKIQNNLLGNPSFVDVRKDVFDDGVDIFDFFVTKVKNKTWVMPIAKNVNCPKKILEQIVTDYEMDGDLNEVVQAAIKNENYQPEKEAIEKMISSDDESIVKKGLIINATKFPENLIEFEVSLQFDKEDLENDGVESLLYDTAAKQDFIIKSGGPIEYILKDFRFLHWLKNIYLDASQFSVTSNFDSNPVPGDDYIESYTRLVFKCLTHKIKNIEDGHPNFDDVLENFISTERRSWLGLIDDEKLFEWLEMASKNIVLLPDVGAPERSMDIFSVANLIEFSDGLNEDSLKDWFENYRSDEGIPQGDEYYDNSIIKQVILPNGTKQSIEIQIEGITYEKEKINKIDSMKDFDILIEGSVDWSKGLWNTFTLELDDKVMFDETKITAEGELGVIEEYHYDGKPFQSKEDWRLEDGSPSVDISIFLDGDIHEINIDELQGELEKADKDPKNIEHLKDWIKNKIAKEKNIVKVEQLLKSDTPEAGIELLKSLNRPELNQTVSELIKNVIDEKYFEGKSEQGIVNEGLAIINQLLPKISTLSMVGCYMESLDISNFSELESLDLSYCDSLKEIKGLNNLKNLKYLDLSFTCSLKNLDKSELKDINKVIGLRDIYGMVIDEKVEQVYWEYLDEYLDNEFQQILENNNENVEDYLGSNINVVIEESDFYDGSFNTNRYFFKPLENYLSNKQMKVLPVLAEDEVAVFLFHDGWDFITSFHRHKDDF